MSDLQVDLEHKDVLLAHCMKREAEEVTYHLGSPSHVYKGKEGDSVIDSGLTQHHRSVCQEAIWRGTYKCGFWDKKVWFQIPALLLSYHCVPSFASLLDLRNNIHLENDSGLFCHYEEYIR